MKPDNPKGLLHVLRSHPATVACEQRSTSLACRRRGPESLHSCAPARRCGLCTRAQVEFMSVEPKVYDQEAKLHDLALQLPAVGSMDRHPAHHTGADGGDLCQAGARQHWRHWMAGFWQVGRAWAAWRHAHIVWKLLVSAFQWCAWICEYVTRWFACVRAAAACWQRTSCWPQKVCVFGVLWTSCTRTCELCAVRTPCGPDTVACEV